MTWNRHDWFDKLWRGPWIVRRSWSTCWAVSASQCTSPTSARSTLTGSRSTNTPTTQLKRVACSIKLDIQADDNGTRFQIPLFVGPELGGGEGPAGEIGDAIAGFWEDVGIRVEVLKYAYGVFRPGLVSRSTVVPMLTSCDDGKESYPFDWPKGLVQTTLTRGGFSCGFESPEILAWYEAAASEPDRRRTHPYQQGVPRVHAQLGAVPGLRYGTSGLLRQPELHRRMADACRQQLQLA